MDCLTPGNTILAPAAVLVPGQGYLIIAGERRAAARIAQGRRTITLHVVRTWSEFMAWLLLDKQWASQHAGLAHIAQPMNLVDAAWWVRKVMEHVRTRRDDVAERVMAEYLGLEVERIRDAKYQLRWLDHEDEAVRAYAASQLRYVAQGVLAATSAGGRIARFVEGRTVVPVKTQRAVLDGASSQLAGLADALRPLATALTEELTDPEIDAYLRHLSEGRLQTERVIRALKAIKERRTA